MKVKVTLADVFSEITDEELIDEVHKRSLDGEFTEYVTEYVECQCDKYGDDKPDEYTLDFDINIIYDNWQRGNKKEALFLIERFFPKLVDISKLLD